MDNIDRSNKPKGEPRVISDTRGEDITPQNPEIVKLFPVDLTDRAAVDRVENDGTNKEKK